MRDSTYFTELAGPLGSLLLVSKGEALAGLYFEEHKPAPKRDGTWRRDDGPFKPVREQLAAYFEGELVEFDLHLVLEGTDFQRSVWNAMRAIPFAETDTYARLANRLGQPTAVRAVGAAIGRNPISIIIPCHRMVGTNGSLTDYAGGLDRKEWLLRHEAAVVVSQVAQRCQKNKMLQV